jgi:Transposase and inactivated derivatives
MTAVASTLEVSRSRQYERRKNGEGSRKRHYRKADDEGYLFLIRRITDDRPTYGYRRVSALLNRQMMRENRPRVNAKRVYRLMKINGLLLQRYTGRPARLHEGRIRMNRSNRRWCSDAFEIACWNGERVRVAFSLDCCDREIMSYIGTTGGISGDLVRDLMAEAIEARFGLVDKVPAPIQWLSDNGPGYVAHETQRFARMMGLEVCTTPFYSPESNGMAESFVKTFKRDYVHMNSLPDAVTVLAQLPTWFEDYNENHPHKGLKMKSPREYRRKQLKLEQCPVN